MHQCIVRPRLCCSWRWFANGRAWCPFASSAGSGMIRVDWNYRHGFLPKSMIIMTIFPGYLWYPPRMGGTSESNYDLRQLIGRHDRWTPICVSAYLRICGTKISQK
jgi:hypothetical protein